MKLVLLVAGVAIALIAGAGVYLWSGAYDVAADVPHWPFTGQFLETAREHSIAQRAGGIEVPELGDDAKIRQGAGNYDAMCAGCHLAPGVEQSELAAGLNPPPPNLSRHEVATPAEAFWTIKHGVKMTGMPAWGAHMDDDAIWGIVALMQRLPEMTPARYRELVAASGGHSHGAEPTAETTPAEGETHVHEDGSAHQH